MIKFRLAESADIDKLASVHLECTRKQLFGSMSKYGMSYFKIYYKILLKEKYRIILIAEDESGIISGFVSGTLSAEDHLMEMNKNKFRLAYAAIPALLRHPIIVRDLIKRKKYLKSGNQNTQYIIASGARVDYWGWLHSNKHMSIPLFRAWLRIAFERGTSSIRGDVYAEDINLVNIQKFNGAKIINEVICHDGRKRYVIEFVNEKS